MTKFVRAALVGLQVLTLVAGASLASAAAADWDVALRIDALRQQAQLRFGAESGKATQIEAAIVKLLDAWALVPRPSDGDHRRLNRWLDRAFAATLPGKALRLPTVPVFVGSPTLVQPEGIVRPTIEPPVTALPAPRQPEVAPSPTGGAIPSEATADAGPSFAALEATEVEVAKPIVPAPTAIVLPTENELRRQATESIPPAEPTQPAEPTRSRWSRHPSAAPLDWQDPFADDPSASVNPLRPGVTHRVRRPAFSSPMTVAVDLKELSARVRGFNNAVRSLQQRLLADPAPDAFSLADWADELERLDEERSFLDLYRDGLPPDAVRLLPPSPSIELVSELLRRRATDQLEARNDRGAVEQRALETISARMSRLGGNRAGL